MIEVSMFTNTPIKASNIIGKNVVNPYVDNLGTIKEVVVDPKSGRVAYVVVTFGGFLTIGEKLFAIPFGAFEYSAINDEYILNISKTQLDNAPGFDSKQLANHGR